MPKISYLDKRFSAAVSKIIEQANEIIEEYARQGYDLTLRQLYYQFVSRNILPNLQTEYKRLGNIISDARLVGLIDWNAITDRTRNLHTLNTWANPGEIIQDAAGWFRHDLWAAQPYRVECWIEKEALSGVFIGVCDELRLPLFACRGYTSQSEMWVAAQRLRGYSKAGQKPLILHFGDHDPSGLDMTRDIEDRLQLFRARCNVERLALNMDQIEQYAPPENPVKLDDSRSPKYVAEHGEHCWELDALEPAVLVTLLRDAVDDVINQPLWDDALVTERDEVSVLRSAAELWPEIAVWIYGREEDDE